MSTADFKSMSPSSLRIKDGMMAASYRAKFMMKNPDYFKPDGIWLWCGAQGTGKTISLVRTLKKVKREYPACRIISNLNLHGVKYENFIDAGQLLTESNGVCGVVFAIDEIQVIFNSLESKDIPVSTIAALCQNRKNRRLILGTSQVYSRIAKPVREQTKYITMCKNYFNLLQYNQTIDPSETKEMPDGSQSGSIVKNTWFFHSKELYEAYDTYEIIRRKN